MGKIIVLSSGGVDSVALGYALARDNPDTEILPIYMRTKLSPSYWIREEGSNERVFAMTNGNGTVGILIWRHRQLSNTLRLESLELEPIGEIKLF